MGSASSAFAPRQPTAQELEAKRIREAEQVSQARVTSSYKAYCRTLIARPPLVGPVPILTRLIIETLRNQNGDRPACERALNSWLINHLEPGCPGARAVHLEAVARRDAGPDTEVNSCVVRSVKFFLPHQMFDAERTDHDFDFNDYAAAAEHGNRLARQHNATFFLRGLPHASELTTIRDVATVALQVYGVERIDDALKDQELRQLLHHCMSGPDPEGRYVMMLPQIEHGDRAHPSEFLTYVDPAPYMDSWVRSRGDE